MFLAFPRTRTVWTCSLIKCYCTVICSGSFLKYILRIYRGVCPKMWIQNKCVSIETKKGFTTHMSDSYQLENNGNGYEPLRIPDKWTLMVHYKSSIYIRNATWFTLRWVKTVNKWDPNDSVRSDIMCFSGQIMTAVSGVKTEFSSSFFLLAPRIHELAAIVSQRDHTDVCICGLLNLHSIDLNYIILHHIKVNKSLINVKSVLQFKCGRCASQKHK